MTSNETQLNEIESMFGKFGKLKLADRARLMAENQTTLERVSKAEEAHRDYGQRVREAQAKQVFGANWDPPMPQKAGSGEDQMQIFIDSPITVGQQAPPPASPPPTNATPPPSTEQPIQQPTPVSAEQPTNRSRWLLPLALAGALGTGVAIPLAYLALQPKPSPPTPTIQFPGYEMPAYDVEKWVP
jgi:hypothetical protein